MAKRLTFLFVIISLIAFDAAAQVNRGKPAAMTSDGDISDSDHDHEHDHEHDHPADTARVSTAPYYFKTFRDNIDTFHVAIDTALHGVHIYNPMDKQSISSTTLGNFGSPYQSNVYFDRPEVDFLFSDVYNAYYKNYKTLPYVNSRTPFTILSYGSGGPKTYAEESVSFLFSQNVNKDINFGAYFDLIYGRGRYSDQSTRHKNYGAYASYDKEKYHAYFNIGANVLENYENGGFGSSDAWDDTNVTNPSSGIGGQAINYPVRIDGARSYLKSQFITLNHKYNIGVMREVETEDSVEMEFVPALNLVHQFKFEVDVKQYEDDDAVTSYYDTAYINSSSSMDSVRSRRISNRLGLYLDERINRYGKFGAGAYIQMDNVYLSNDPWTSIEDTSLQKGWTDLLADNSNVSLDSSRLDFIHAYDGYSYTDVSVGASIFKRTGTHFFFDAAGQVYLSGYNAGDWKLDGTMRQSFPGMGNWNLTARAKFARQTPDYFLQHYYANNFWWDNSFDATFTQQLGGTLEIPTINFKVSVDIDNMQNHVYYNEDALPTQYSDNLAVLALRLEKDFEIGNHLVWENDVVYQTTSSDRVLPLPELTLYSNFYLKHILFEVLHFHLGVDCRYYTEYYAPGYMPATGRYYNQREVQIGNYPLMNVYADFFLRRMRFFVMGQHINMGWPELNYFSAPHYAYNPRMFKMGLQWTFYD